jgi:sugar phosphate isomerase/epimerase
MILNRWNMDKSGFIGIGRQRSVAGLFLYMFLIAQCAVAQPVKNQFFALHNIIRGDSTYNTFDKQVELIKAAGYDAIEINQIDSFDGMKEALDKHHFKGAYFYVKLKLEEPYIDPRLRGDINRLKGSGVIIAPFIVSESKKFKPSQHEADTLVVRLIHQISDWAKDANLEIAIYPHLGFYVERTGHALELVKLINRKNVGLSFNLCHWLATTTEAERSSLNEQLKNLRPYLKMITVSGANNVMSREKSVWEDYILPLGKGTFDTYGLLRYAVRDLKFQGPIGVQCYNIKGDKPTLVQNTINVWRTYRARLEANK